MQTPLTCREEKKITGCMSGIFHFLSPHNHKRSRKRITSAEKKLKVAAPAKSASQQQEKAPPPPINDGEHVDSTRSAAPENAFSGEKIRRSPTLASEIRRPGAAASPDSPRGTPRAAVARLMGLDEGPAAIPSESSTEKRRKLLGALERCDEDLRALKRIIDAVHVAERSAAAVVGSPAVSTAGYKDSRMDFAMLLEGNGEQPSPVSVLDGLASPISRMIRSDNGEHHKKARGTTDENIPFFRPISIKGLSRAIDRIDGFGFSRRGEAAVAVMDGRQQRRWRWWSRGMVESVAEVCEDGGWEERWEYERVGVRLEGELFRDLLEEIVMQMLGGDHCRARATCKKMLCF